MMSFGLKNAKATYQRAVTTIFHVLSYKTLEDYMDGVLVKSHNIMDHLSDLEIVFDRLAKYQLMLNPNKYVLVLHLASY